jgi:hypothetical protein
LTRLAALLAALAVYTAAAGSLWDASLWWDVAWLALVLFPATLAVPWLALPYARVEGSGLLLVAIALGAAALALRAADADVLFNLAKLLALTAVGFWFLQYFESPSWVAAVAAIVPWVDALSVWRGPTEYVVDERPGAFESVSVAFRVPGEDDAAHVGPPDILFFALFLAAAVRFGLRPRLTWLLMTGLLGATIVLAVWTETPGLPALPALSVGFLLANADVFWRRLVKRRVRVDQI